MKRDKFDSKTEEDSLLLDVECESRYENVNPGTLTVEGFGMECWDYEEHHSDKERDNTVFVDARDLPGIPAKKLLRRIHELQRGGDKFGWNRDKEVADMKELFGITG
jgi:hypothetical protein